MPSKSLKIVSVSSEVAPFSKTGGLGDVARSLPKALKRLGQDIIVVTPLYEKIIDKNEYDLKLIFKDVYLKINQKESVKINFWKGYMMKGLPIYFVENAKYFSRRKSLYGSEHENARFLVFNLAALKLISLLKFEADIVHCHDWQTGLIPYFLKNNFRDSQTLRKTKSIFTIHNLVFQLGHNWWEIPPSKKDYGKKSLPLISDPGIEYVNFAKRGILYADAVNTVSEQYREEILTKNFGQDLQRILKNREKKVFGIINGIDYNDYNPRKDKALFKNYDYKKTRRKRANKERLQSLLKLKTDGDIPVLAMTSRVTFQKGFELITKILEPLLNQNLEIIVMGDGDKKYINEVKKIGKKYPEKIVWVPFSENENMETLIYAGADIFLLPSHHEPCGINQLIAMRYGCIPVVRSVGGLFNTVENYDPQNNKGTGFNFNGFDIFSLYASVVRALEMYKHKKIWRDLMIRAMKEANGWEIPAKKYLTLFKKTIKNKI